MPFRTLLALGVVLALAACEKPSTEPQQAVAREGVVVLARIGDAAVTSEELGALAPGADPKRRLEQVIQRRLAADEARRRGLDQERKTAGRIATLRRDAHTREEGLLRNALYNSIRLGLEVDDADLREQYEATKSRYTERQWELRVRSFENEEAAAAHAASLGTHGRLDPAQSQTLGPAPADKLPQGVLPVLHLLTTPGARAIAAVGFRWSVVELVSFQPQAQIPFEAVRDKIEESLRATRAQQQLEAELARLQSERKVSIDDAAVAEFAKRRAERFAEDEPAEEPEPQP